MCVYVDCDMVFSLFTHWSSMLCSLLAVAAGEAYQTSSSVQLAPPPLPPPAPPLTATNLVRHHRTSTVARRTRASASIRRSFITPPAAAGTSRRQENRSSATRQTLKVPAVAAAADDDVCVRVCVVIDMHVYMYCTTALVRLCTPFSRSVIWHVTAPPTWVFRRKDVTTVWRLQTRSYDVVI